ncbi:hypothetical protein RRG08_062755 [Elysia crispata]|uniref:Uncharacterized protein n=1 Tax=Elysia crispata TaxID=231223 RepID=A0AAE1B3B9_9GAST|nr:hypothetical protein RRG08_062755 [Elysia crispata]
MKKLRGKTAEEHLEVGWLTNKHCRSRAGEADRIAGCLPLLRWVREGDGGRVLREGAGRGRWVTREEEPKSGHAKGREDGEQGFSYLERDAPAHVTDSMSACGTGAGWVTNTLTLPGWARGALAGPCSCTASPPAHPQSLRDSSLLHTTASARSRDYN